MTTTDTKVAVKNQDVAGQAGGEASSLLFKILGALGTGVGLLGFVTLFGGAILWIRANEAQLPATEVIAVVPKAVLVTTGANFLVPAVLLALGVVLVVSAVRFGFWIPGHYKASKIRGEANDLRYSADQALGEAAPKEQSAANALERAVKASEVADEASQRADVLVGNVLGELQKQAQERWSDAQRAKEAAEHLRGSADALNATAGEKEGELKQALIKTPTLDSAEFWLERGLSGLALAIVPLAAYGSIGSLTAPHIAILVIVAIVAALVSLGIYMATERLVWFAVASFLAVGIYAGFATYFRTTETPKVQPVAALRGKYQPVVGLFIAETASNLYVGTFEAGGDSPRMLVIPRAQVTDTAIGPLLAVAPARDRAFEIALEECGQSVDQPKGKPPVSVCSDNQLKSVEALREPG